MKQRSKAGATDKPKATKPKFDINADLDVSLVDIAKVRPYASNPRNNDGAVDAVAASIKEFGFRQPIVVDEKGVVIIGHTRLKAAYKLDMTQVPVHVAKGLSPEQTRALRIADNKTHELSTWDNKLLSAELAALAKAAPNIDFTQFGYSQGAIDVLLSAPGNAGETDPDNVPAPPDKAKSKRGDIYQLGAHRLMCGDSGSVADLDRLLNGAKIHLVNTDPPYNVNVQPRSNNAIAAGLSSFGETNVKPTIHQQKADHAKAIKEGRSTKTTHKQLRAKDRPIANDFVSDADFEKMLDAWFGNIARVLIPGCAFYIWGGYSNWGNYTQAFKKQELHFAQGIIWNKMHPVLGRKDFMNSHESCFYGWREGAAHRFFGPNNATDMWEVKKVHSASMVHLTEKPVELARRAIEYSSQQGENVLDLFGGSGSTLIACEQTGRKGHLMEMDPLYVDVIIERWEKFTNKKAKKVSG